MSHRKTTEEFVLQAKNKWGNFFDYSKTVYIKNDFKVIIRCVLHGLEFEQTPSNHLSFNGCQKCLEEEQRKRFQKTSEDFISSARIRHGDKYDYSQVVYVNNHTKVIIVCPKHGSFEVTPINHLKANEVDCQKCGFEKLPGSYFDKYFERHPENSNKPAILYFIKLQDQNDYTFYKLGITTQDIKRRFANPVYAGFEITPIWVARGPLIITYGLERHLKRIYANIRTKVQYIKFHGSTECFTEEIPCCVIPEAIDVNEITYELDILLSRMLIKSGICEHHFSARKLRLEKVPIKAANEFFNKYHIQGLSHQGVIAYGLFDGNELICAMSFGRPRFRKDYEYELIRFATKTFTIVAGGASRLLKAFVREYHPQTIVSYSDRFWNEGRVYTLLGFIKSHTTSPNYWYVKDGVRLSRIKCQKHKLISILGEKFDPTKSEAENMFTNGYQKIFDHGQDVFVWSKIS